MDRIQKNFGFGFMRLPMAGEEVDIPQTTKMVDAFLEAGFNYFDTAHGYLQGKSERALKTCLTSRYPREKYILTNKLTANFFQTEEDIRPFFESQLEACGVDYFDFYLMHAQGAGNYPHFQACHAYEVAQRLKAEGKVRHVGISFHDSAEMLEKILTDHPEIYTVMETSASYLANHLRASAEKYGLSVQVNQIGSLMCPYFAENSVKCYADAKKSDTKREKSDQKRI